MGLPQSHKLVNADQAHYVMSSGLIAIVVMTLFTNGFKSYRLASLHLSDILVNFSLAVFVSGCCPWWRQQRRRRRGRRSFGKGGQVSVRVEFDNPR